MGYRSDVVAAFYVSKAEHLPALKLWLDENFPMDMFDAHIRWFDRGMVLQGESWKWYDSYPDVQAFNAAADKFVELCNNDVAEDTPTFNYEFMRVGEDYDDVDVVREGVGYECVLGVQREITVEV